MSKLLLISAVLLSSFCTMSCNKKDGDAPKKGGGGQVNLALSGSFDFTPVDAHGNNLLVGNAPLTIDDFDIVLYDKNGGTSYFYDRFLGDPKGIDISWQYPEPAPEGIENKIWVRVHLMESRFLRDAMELTDGTITETHLRIGDKIHIIKGLWSVSNAESNADMLGGLSIEVTKIWVDNDLVYTADDIDSQMCKILVEHKK